uniref:Uncharacterized protein n=1 Tax=Nelumbo nucifera TaxID=4432 RepID=A0A822ZLV4_NELNU|nr:TPA_asm: hypothetical protein HUJ06_002599 [Nelumbo nucifera]
MGVLFFIAQNMIHLILTVEKGQNLRRSLNMDILIFECGCFYIEFTFSIFIRKSKF